MTDGYGKQDRMAGVRQAAFAAGGGNPHPPLLETALKPCLKPDDCVVPQIGILTY